MVTTTYNNNNNNNDNDNVLLWPSLDNNNSINNCQNYGHFFSFSFVFCLFIFFFCFRKKAIFRFGRHRDCGLFEVRKEVTTTGWLLR